MDDQERAMYLGWAKTQQFKNKVNESIGIIEEALTLGDSYVSISWGKDSIALLHLCQSVFPEILAINFSTPHEDMLGSFTQTANAYCSKFSTNLNLIKIEEQTVIPKAVKDASLWETYPVAFVGLRAEESKGRRKSLTCHGLLYQYKAKGYRVCPIGFWKAIDIWAYLAHHDIPYLSNYDIEGNRQNVRTTNVMPFRGGLSQSLGRIENIKRYNKDAYNYLREKTPWLLT